MTKTFNQEFKERLSSNTWDRDITKRIFRTRKQRFIKKISAFTSSFVVILVFAITFNFNRINSELAWQNQFLYSYLTTDVTYEIEVNSETLHINVSDDDVVLDWE